MATRSWSGSMTSPLPEITNRFFVSPTQQQRLEAAQVAIAAPVLRELDRGAREVAELLELAFEALEQRERVGRAAGEPAEHLAIAERGAPCVRCPSSPCCRA